MKKILLITSGLIVVFVVFLFGRFMSPYRELIPSGDELLVYNESSDAVVNGGMLFLPKAEATKGCVVLWIHGWGTNFYDPTYTKIAREIALNGHTVISANTRMHDLGTSMKYDMTGRRIRGGGYWAKASEQYQDIKGWIDYIEKKNLGKVILVGHSAGWAAVRDYQYLSADKRVLGLISASGSIYSDTSGLNPQDSVMLGKAVELKSRGLGDELIKIEGRSFPSYISADTYYDNMTEQTDQRDFFGIKQHNVPASKVRLPFLVFFGARGDVGDKHTLDQVEEAAKRININITTQIISGADHIYKGKEAEVAKFICLWIDNVVLQQYNNNL